MQVVATMTYLCLLTLVKKPDVVIDLATAVDHTRTVDLTDAARFALGTTNRTKKYTTRKKALLSEFVSVLKKQREVCKVFGTHQ
jgi:hypothetical protein